MSETTETTVQDKGLDLTHYSRRHAYVAGQTLEILLKEMPDGMPLHYRLNESEPDHAQLTVVLPRAQGAYWQEDMSFMLPHYLAASGVTLYTSEFQRCEGGDTLTMRLAPGQDHLVRPIMDDLAHKRDARLSPEGLIELLKHEGPQSWPDLFTPCTKPVAQVLERGGKETEMSK